MKKLKKLWRRIPRPVRVVCNILAILMVLSTFYVSIGAPTLTKEQAFRREERANLLGPSTILFNEKVENYQYGTLIVGETDHGVITWVDDSWYGLNYHEKTGDITVVSAPKYWFDWGGSDFAASLPVFVLHEYPEAEYAWLFLDIEGTYTHNLNGENLNETLNHSPGLWSNEGSNGFFYFTLDVPYRGEGSYRDDAGGLADDGYALDALSQTFTNFRKTTNPQSSISIIATVMLYDKNDSLLAERELVLRTLSDTNE